MPLDIDKDQSVLMKRRILVTTAHLIARDCEDVNFEEDERGYYLSTDIGEFRVRSYMIGACLILKDLQLDAFISKEEKDFEALIDHLTVGGIVEETGFAEYLLWD